jgi:divinyl chlorophyllide a 8-vinyl-reductase
MTSLSILLLGGTGTIGRATAQALRAEGHQVTALIRPSADASHLSGCTLIRGEVTPDTLAAAMPSISAVVSCLASRTGAPKDAWAVDHAANSAALKAAVTAGVRHFTLLSAICVQKPLLDFQRAKLAFEAELQDASLDWTIVRPTAYFKSLSGQVARVQENRPFLVFGNGKLTACKPISDADLGRFLALTLTDPDKRNRILPIGGPGPAITPLDQAAMLERLFRRPELSALGTLSPRFAARAGLARIGRYYATQSMLVWDPVTQSYDADATPEFGTDRLEDHYAAMLRGEVGDDRGAHAIF